jgi:hypothetical protein
MFIYNFESGKTLGLFAFAADQAGRRLPDKFGPWKLTQRINPDVALPHDLDRGTVEQALAATGFQMWRRRKES